ncbi:MAG: LytR family transcriptional regulator [Treponema sp.]|nr:MAG: LytR family transcriptional regulator [Treponema sp.]
MKISRKFRELAFLIFIILLFIGGAVFLIFKIKKEPATGIFSEKNIVNVLVIIEDNGKAVSSNVISYYPPTKRAAMFDIPANTGLILKSLSRTDGIAALYSEKGVDEYLGEVEKLTGIPIPAYMIITVEGLSYITDMLGGLSIFIPTPVDIDTEHYRVLLPSGSISLDGDKISEYLVYEDTEDTKVTVAYRKQKILLSLLRELNDHREVVFSKKNFKEYFSGVSSNLEEDELKKLLFELCKVDVEKLVPQRLTGSEKVTADNKKLLFPFRDGRQFKEVVKQALSVLASEDDTVLERVYALEILNGTEKRGLAGKTSEMFQSFGYDVVIVGNSESSAKETILIDRIGNPAVAGIIADIIKCTNIKSAELPNNDELTGTETAVDFTLILGEDFNGYYVRKKE